MEVVEYSAQSFRGSLIRIWQRRPASLTKSHNIYTVADVAFAEERLRAGGVEIISDDQPIPGKPRFYVRDPGGNLIELAQGV